MNSPTKPPTNKELLERLQQLSTQVQAIQTRIDRKHNHRFEGLYPESERRRQLTARLLRGC